MVSYVLVWIQFDLSQLGIFVNSFVDPLGWLLQGEFVVFPLELPLDSLELFPLEFTTELGSTISPNDSHEALIGPMTSPSDVVNQSLCEQAAGPGSCALQGWMLFGVNRVYLCR